jgi:hypothetical protein
MADLDTPVGQQEQTDTRAQRDTVGAAATGEEANTNPMEQSQIEIQPSQVEEVSRWLQDELFRSEQERSGLEEKIRYHERLYEAEPEQEEKDFPWPGASNIVVPVISTAVEAVFARMMNSIFGGKELWITQARSPDWRDLAQPSTRFLNWVGESVVGMYDVCQQWFLGMLKHGTGILKTRWDRLLRKVVYNDPIDGMVNENVVLKDGPGASAVELRNFFVSSDILQTMDIQTCTWVAHRAYYTWKRLKELEVSGVFYDVERIKQEERSTAEDVEADRHERTGIEPVSPRDYEVFEVWCSYDLEGNGVLSELIVDIHKDTGTILRAVYNPFRHQERPFHVIRNMPREGSFWGIGIAEMLEQVQEEITKIHNHRLDNQLLANTRAFKKRKGSSLGNDEIFPGAFIEVDEPDDLMELQLGESYQTLLVEEQHTNAIGEKRTGVSDYTVGRESSAIGSRATATSTLALIREGNKRFQLTIRDIRQSLGDIGHQFLTMYQQFAPDRKVSYEMFSQEDAMWMQKFMHLPGELSRKGLIIDTPALSETNNKEMMQQSMMTLMQVVQQFYMSMFQAMGVAGDPNAPPALKQLAVKGGETGSMLLERILESFDINDAENYVPDINSLINLTMMAEGMQNGGMGAPAGPGGQGAAGPGAQGAQGPSVGQNGQGAGNQEAASELDLAGLTGLGAQ